MKKETQQVCQRAAEFYYEYLSDPSSVPPDVCQHLEQCSFCQAELCRLRSILAAPEASVRTVQQELVRCQIALFERWIGCSQVKPFLPLLTIAEFLPSVPTPAAAHLAHCSACRQDRAALERLALTAEQAISASRALSGTPDTEKPPAGGCAEIVERIRRRPATAVLTRLSRNPSDGNFQIAVAQEAAACPQEKVWTGASVATTKWLRPVAAAAVLLLATVFLWQVNPARGLDINEVYQALGQAVNVAITSYPQEGQNLIIASYALEEQRPLQEIWVSNTLGIHLFIEKERSVLWDLNRQKKLVKTASGIFEIPITESVKRLEIPWGLLPFRSPSELPSRYKWKQVRPSDDQPLSGDVRVYDLTWTDYSTSGWAVQRRWRGYLEVATKCPLRIEWWEKLDSGPFRKVTSTQIRYPQDAEVFERIAAVGFDYCPAVQK